MGASIRTKCGAATICNWWITTDGGGATTVSNEFNFLNLNSFIDSCEQGTCTVKVLWLTKADCMDVSMHHRNSYSNVLCLSEIFY